MRWTRLDPVPVELRVLLVEEGVEGGPALLPEAHPEAGRPHGMYHHGLPSLVHDVARLDQAEAEIGVLTPGPGEGLVEAVQALEHLAPAEGVGRHEARLREARRVALVV